MSELFRKKTLDRISAPEELDSYMKVVKPSVWMVLIAILLLLVGGIVWSLTGSIESTADCYVLVKDNTTTVFVPEMSGGQVAVGMTVDIYADETSDSEIKFSGIITKKNDDLLTGSDLLGEKVYAFGIGNLNRRFYECEVDINGEGIQDGLYLGLIHVETIKPISFIE